MPVDLKKQLEQTVAKLKAELKQLSADGDVVNATLVEVGGEEVDGQDYELSFDEGFITDIRGPAIDGIPQNWSFLLDIKIIFLTIWNMFRGEENAG